MAALNLYRYADVFKSKDIKGSDLPCLDREKLLVSSRLAFFFFSYEYHRYFVESLIEQLFINIERHERLIKPRTAVIRGNGEDEGERTSRAGNLRLVYLVSARGGGGGACRERNRGPRWEIENSLASTQRR